MNKIIAVFLVALCMTVCVTAYSDGVQADLQDNLIRLHIIADSDDDNDQAVKLKVRDAILKNVGDRLSKTVFTKYVIRYIFKFIQIVYYLIATFVFIRF